MKNVCKFAAGLDAGPTAVAATIRRQYLMQPEVGSTYERMNKHRLVSNTIRER